jgi:hypothetical protein
LRNMKQYQGGSGITSAHGGFKKALQAAYPELQFTKWQQTKKN